jgi:hypothetical protein
VWQHLFINHNPISEATRGVTTVLCALGLNDGMGMRDLQHARNWYDQQVMILSLCVLKASAIDRTFLIELVDST